MAVLKIYVKKKKNLNSSSDYCVFTRTRNDIIYLPTLNPIRLASSVIFDLVLINFQNITLVFNKRTI